jgi:hypothetical protein
VRRLAFFVALLLVVPAVAAAGEVTADENWRGDGVEYSGSVPGSPPHPQAGKSRSGGSAGPSTPVYPAYAPTLSTDADGVPCVGVERRTFDTAQSAAAFDQAQEVRWQTLIGQYAMCPGVEVPVQNPAILAEAFWGEVLLPRPTPRIEPGWAMTGRLAYLETQAPMTQTFTRDTPLGPLTITATGEFLVDWGDGTTTGPHTDAGAPWPDGRITHGYIDTGTVDVVVTEQWRATWALGTSSGTLTALRTEGRIDALPVHEVQAVRNR